MTRTSILSVIPTLESGPGSQRLRSPNCVPGAEPVARPRKSRGTEYGGPVRTQRAESFRNRRGNPAAVPIRDKAPGEIEPSDSDGGSGPGGPHPSLPDGIRKHEPET